MRALRIAPFVLLFALSITSVILATDYRPDTTYADLGFTSTDVVYDVFVHPDGKFVVAGEDFTGNSSVPFLRRYFPNGTIDSSFVSGLATTGGTQNQVTDIVKVYPNGTYIVRGRFNAGTFGHWARLTSDGRLDGTVPLTVINSHVRVAQDDGKLLFCGPRVENGVTYDLLFRRNADLSFDPTFRITFSEPFNGCPEGIQQADGKILITGEFSTGGQPLKQLQRVNSDGSLDPTFNPDVNTGLTVRVLKILADGKILVGDFTTLKLLNPDGSQVWANSNCTTSFAIQMADGSFMANGCRKWASGTALFSLSRVRSSDGAIDQSMDRIYISGFEGLKGFREDGNGGLYLYGGISMVSAFSRRGLVRVMPDTTPPKARFDFDGDGKSDLAVFRPSDGIWYLNQSTAGFGYRQWGLSTDRVAAADADRDGTTDAAVFRDGAWHALTSNGVHYYMCLGAAGDKPLVGIKNELGIGTNQEFLVARGLRSGAMRWFIRGGYTNCWVNNQQPQPETLSGETSNDKPVVGDFNGDSLDEIGFFRDGFWYGEDADGVAAPTSIQWGSSGDIPVPGDYDGDRQTDYAVFRPSTGEWWINRSTAGAIVITFGLNGDIPVPADYDGDGKVDIGIYRNGQWWQFRMGTGTVAVGNWGIAGDIPIPAQHQF